MSSTSYSEILKIQTDQFIEILKNQNDKFIDILKSYNNTTISILKKIEEEREYYFNLSKGLNSNQPIVKENEYETKERIDNNDYDTMINNYYLSHNRVDFIKIIECFPSKIYETLNFCINILPENIMFLAETHNFKDELAQILTKLSHIKKLESNNIDVNKSFKELCDNYYSAFINEKPTLIKRYIKQIYIQFPESYNNFIENYKKYLPDYLPEFISNINKEYKNSVSKEVDNVKKKPRIDYNSVNILDLVDMCKNSINKSQYKKMYHTGLVKSGRSEKDCEMFLNKV
jgi:hypothetical protein